MLFRSIGSWKHLPDLTLLLYTKESTGAPPVGIRNAFGKAGARRSAAGPLQLVIKARAAVRKSALSGSHGSQIQRS